MSFFSISRGEWMWVRGLSEDSITISQNQNQKFVLDMGVLKIILHSTILIVVNNDIMYYVCHYSMCRSLEGFSEKEVPGEY